MENKKILYLVIVGLVAVVLVCVLLAGLVDGFWPWSNDRDEQNNYTGITATTAAPTETQDTTIVSTDGTAVAPTEDTTVPATTEPATKPTETITQPTEITTQPTEPTTKPTEPTTKPTEPTTKPTEPTTQPTEPTTKPTEPSQGLNNEIHTEIDIGLNDKDDGDKDTDTNGDFGVIDFDDLMNGYFPTEPNSGE